jgi:hypothetical protein
LSNDHLAHQTPPHTQERATEDFRISLGERRIALAARLFSASGRAGPGDAASQLKRWSKFSEPPRVPGGAGRMWFSGKGKTGTMNDDLAMCILLNHAVFRLLTSFSGTARYAVASKLPGTLVG